jgi:putative membrane protein
MFIELLLFLFLGILTGVVTGLIPGLHPNTLFIIILSLSDFIYSIPTPLFLTFIISAALCNTFVNFIPSILLGAPEPDSCLSVLPGHRFLMEGNGYEALYLTVAGGVGVTLLTLVAFPLLIILIPAAYGFIHQCIHVILIFIAAWMILDEKHKAGGLIIFILSGLFGLITLNSFPSKVVLFPALTGLFGTSAIIVSMISKTVIPPQKEPGNVRIIGRHVKGSVAGWLSGMLTGLLPGIGAAQAGVIVAQTLKANTKDFLTALGGINTSNIFFTFIVFYTLGKTRSGAAWTISQVMDSVSFFDILILVFVGATACFISAIITLRIGRFAIMRITSFDYNRVNMFILVTLIVLVYIFSGPIGLLIVAVGTCIGLLTILGGTRRIQLMGFLIFPTILYFSGLNAYILVLLGL